MNAAATAATSERFNIRYLLSFCEPCKCTNGKGAERFHLHRNGVEPKSFIGKAGEVCHVFDDGNLTTEQHGMNRPAPARGIVDIV